MCRIMDSVPGSLAAAPRPITARAAISTPMFGASAASTEPPQKMPTPISITRLRPNSSPTMPNASMAPANVSAYALTTHCSSLTPACSSVCTLPSATLTIVLSRKVRNSTAASTARASDRLPRRTPVARPAGVSTDRTTWLAGRLADSGRLPAVLQSQQAAEAGQPDFPGSALVDGHAGLVGQRRRTADQDRVLDCGLLGRGHRDLADLRRCRGGQAGPGLRLDDGCEHRPVLQQGDPLRDRGLRVEELFPVGGDGGGGGAAGGRARRCGWCRRCRGGCARRRTGP